MHVTMSIEVGVRGGKYAEVRCRGLVGALMQFEGTITPLGMGCNWGGFGGGPPSITSVHSLRGIVNGFIVLAVDTGWSMGYTPRLLERSMATARSLQNPSVGCI